MLGAPQQGSITRGTQLHLLSLSPSGSQCHGSKPFTPGQDQALGSPGHADHGHWWRFPAHSGCIGLRWARGLLAHAGTGQRGMFLCRGSVAADPRGYKHLMLPMTGEGGRGTSARMVAPTWGKISASAGGAGGVRHWLHHPPLWWGEWNHHQCLHSCAEPFLSRWCHLLQHWGQSRPSKPLNRLPCAPRPAAHGPSVRWPAGLGCAAWGGNGESPVPRMLHCHAAATAAALQQPRGWMVLPCSSSVPVQVPMAG